MSANFDSVPVLDYALLSSPTTRPQFIAQLRHALVSVGFLYLRNPPVAPALVSAVIDYAPRLFALSDDAKERIRMIHSPHFFGYSRLGAEITKGRTDYREQFDFGTEYESDWKEGDVDYLRLWGPAQWPNDDELPDFKTAFTEYLRQVVALSYTFTALIAEAFALPPDALQRFFEEPARMQHRAKVVKYPAPVDDLSSDQGVGPHFDGGFLTFLLQASDHPGLQVQNLAGQWIDAPPIEGTFVVNIGKALETATRGLARATSHRVLSPKPGSTPRYSVPFFQNIAPTIKVGENVLDFSPEIWKLKDERGDVAATDSVNYAEYAQLPSGLAGLIGRVKSHPDVAQRHWPEWFNKYFPDGLPAQGSAY